MKSVIYLSFILISLAMGNPNATHNSKHTFLLKTDLTKEQVENLLNEYHKNGNEALIQETTSLHQNEVETEHDHLNETTELKVKEQKEKKKKEKKEQKEVPQEQEIPKETPEVPKPKEEEVPKASETAEVPEVPKAPEAPETPEAPEAPEVPEAPEKAENEERKETTNLKKKKNKKNEGHHNQNKNETKTNEAKEIENNVENKTVLIQNENNNIKQSNSPILGFFTVIFLTIAFVSFFVYITQPKRKIKNHNNFKELTDYLLVKENQSNKYDLRDF